MVVVIHIGQMVVLQDIGPQVITFTILGLPMVLALVTAVITMIIIGGTTTGVIEIMSIIVQLRPDTIQPVTRH
jgi:hypothetical protein